MQCALANSDLPLTAPEAVARLWRYLRAGFLSMMLGSALGPHLGRQVDPKLAGAASSSRTTGVRVDWVDLGSLHKTPAVAHASDYAPVAVLPAVRG